MKLIRDPFSWINTVLNTKINVKLWCIIGTTWRSKFRTIKRTIKCRIQLSIFFNYKYTISLLQWNLTAAAKIGNIRQNIHNGMGNTDIHDTIATKTVRQNPQSRTYCSLAFIWNAVARFLGWQSNIRGRKLKSLCKLKRAFEWLLGEFFIFKVNS